MIDFLYNELKDLNSKEVEIIRKLVQALKRTRKSPLAYIEEMMNFKAIGYDPEDDVYIYHMSITDEPKNRFKILHGGITATFIDTTMGATVIAAVGEEARAVTLGLSVNFLSPGLEGCLIAKTKIVKKGKSIILMETKVVDEQEKLIATATSTFFCMK